MGSVQRVCLAKTGQYPRRRRVDPDEHNAHRKHGRSRAYVLGDPERHRSD